MPPFGNLVKRGKRKIKVEIRKKRKQASDDATVQGDELKLSYLYTLLPFEYICISSKCFLEALLIIIIIVWEARQAYAQYIQGNIHDGPRQEIPWLSKAEQ